VRGAAWPANMRARVRTSVERGPTVARRYGLVLAVALVGLLSACDEAKKPAEGADKAAAPAEKTAEPTKPSVEEGVANDG